MESAPLEFLDWLVKRRSAIQRDALKILELARKDRETQPHDLAALAIIHLMIGASFSLWRAVFLGRVSLTPEVIAKAGEAYLSTVIETNFIGFPQDHAQREWTFGYYVNNAAVRLGEIERRSLVFRRAADAVHLPELGWTIIATKNAREVFGQCQKALHLAIKLAPAMLDELRSPRALPEP